MATNKFLERGACCLFLVRWWQQWTEGLSHAPARCFNICATVATASGIGSDPDWPAREGGHDCCCGV